MHVTRRHIVTRGLENRCPNCGEHSLFPARSLRVHNVCPVCGMTLNQGAGFWLGPWVINYTITAVCFVVPVILLGVTSVISLTLAVWLAVLGGFGVPVLLYRPSWSWWLMIYFFFFPDKLPANGAGTGAHAQE